MPESRTPPCQHASECNGCPLMEIPYGEQLNRKSAQLNEWFQSVWKERIELIPSESEFRYRGKVELSYVDGLLGYRRKENPRKSFELNECLLVSEKANELIDCVQEWLRKEKIQHYNVMKHEGFLGYAVVRESHSTKEIMVNLVSHNKENAEPVERVSKQLIRLGASSVNWLVNDGWGDNTIGYVKHFWGKPFIEERFLGCSFKIYPNTFFQTNPRMAEKLFREVLEEAKPGERVLDLFCGVGALSIPLAKRCKFVLGIELSEESIHSAIQNKESNGVKNAQFAAGRVQSQLKRLRGEKFDLITIDPPRSGLTIKAVKRVMELNPNKIAYISCNPATLKTDLELFLKEYELVKLKAFDFFPQTNHAEMLAVLEKKE